MKKFIIILPFVLVVLALTMTGCAKPPTEEMNQAQDAVTRAENDADAVQYAGNALVRAREALIKMQGEADAKRYEAARNFAAEAVSNAEKAIADGKAGAARAREEATNLISGLAGPLAETSAAIDAAKLVKNIKLNFDELSGDMDTARRNYDEARQSLLANNYRDASSKSQTVRSVLAGINAKITDAVQAESRKK